MKEDHAPLSPENDPPFDTNSALKAQSWLKRSTEIVKNSVQNLSETAPTAVKQGLTRVYPIVLSILYSFFASSLSLLVKLLSENHSTFQITFFRSVIQGILSFALLYYQEKTFPWNVERKYIWTLVSRSTIGYFSSFFLFFALGKLPLSEAVVIAYIHPVFVAIFAAIFLEEQWHKLDAFGALLCLTGVIFIARPPPLFPQQSQGFTLDHWIGIGFVLAHAVSTGAVVVMIRSMGKGIHALQNVAWLSFVSTIISIIGMLGMRTWHWPSSFEWFELLGMGCVSFIAQYCRSRSLQLEKAAIVSTIGYLQVAFSVMNDFVFYGNLPGLWSGAGVLLICSWAVVSLLKNWFKGREIPLWTLLRLKVMGRSTEHKRLNDLEISMEVVQMDENEERDSKEKE